MKIINIASSDDFEDILEAVRESRSRDLILVVPKSNRIFKNKNKAEKLKIEFDRLGKEVSIISPLGEGSNRVGIALGQKKNVKGKKDKDIVSFYSAPSGELPHSYMSGGGETRPSKNKEKKTEPAKKFILILIGSAFALFIFLVFASLGEADITLIPRKNDFSVNIPVTISDKITEIDEVYGIIPGQWIEVEKVVSKTFSSGAEKDVFQKARGAITIYNNFSVLPQVLVATTRFQIPEGLVFRISNAVTVPGMSKLDGESKLGEVKVEVVADRAGDDYNIGPSDFRIPGFLGSPKYQGFYAKSFEKFSGGFTGRSAFVSKNDLEKAEEATEKEAEQEIRAGLPLIGDFKVLDGAVRQEIEKTGESAKVNDLTKEFKVVLRVKAKALVFREQEAADLVSRYVKNSQNALVLRDGLKMDHVGLKLNEEKRELSFNLASSGRTVQNIDKNRIISELAGKNKDEAKFYLNGLAGIESVRLSFPFWLRKIPKNKDRIDIRIVTE